MWASPPGKPLPAKPSSPTTSWYMRAVTFIAGASMRGPRRRGGEQPAAEPDLVREPEAERDARDARPDAQRVLHAPDARGREGRRDGEQHRHEHHAEDGRDAEHEQHRHRPPRV